MKDRTPVRITLTDVATALPDLVLAGTFALVWLDPSRPGLPSVRRLVMAVLLAFFIVHWTEHPQTALAAGAIYFTIVGLWELLIPPIVFRHDRELAAMERESGIVTA